MATYLVGTIIEAERKAKPKKEKDNTKYVIPLQNSIIYQILDLSNLVLSVEAEMKK